MKTVGLLIYNDKVGEERLGMRWGEMKSTDRGGDNWFKFLLTNMEHCSLFYMLMNVYSP
jgi:hypothetical protein